MKGEPEIIQKVPWKDRSTGLIVFGVLQIGIGGLALLMAAVCVFGMLAANLLDGEAAAGLDARTMVPNILFYGAIGTFFTTVAIGSFQARRWARALVLIASWFWMCCGTLAALGLFFMMDGVFSTMAAQGQMAPEVLQIMKIIIFSMCFVIYLVLPGAHILFYRTRDVRETCNNRNPNPSWTDACPLPVLALAMLFGMWPLSVFYLAAYNWMIPLFGHVLSGPVGAVACLVIAGVGLILARGLYRGTRRAWRGAVVATCLLGVSNLYTFATIDMMNIYEQMGMPEQQLEMIRHFAAAPGANIYPLYGTALGVAGILGLLMYCRRHFVAPT